MLAQKYRIPRQFIDYILKKGDSYTSKFFIIRHKKNNSDFCRYRTIISKKVHAKAVKRNHLRRQIYEILRLNMLNLNVPGTDSILIAKKNIIKNSYKALEEDIKNNIHG
ncbi:ribonuclease P protein component [Candidatus Peregrinibacteria bacterium]|nr:ribonuclease P protein component [Candidatus Peregrinibacteria bacterium]